MKKTIYFLFTLFFFTVSTGCNQKKPSAVNETKPMDSAVQYHIETAAHDLRTSIADATPESVFNTKQFIEYAQMTIPQTIELCNELNENVLSDKLKQIDLNLTTALNGTSGEDLMKAVNQAADDLEKLIQ